MPTTGFLSQLDVVTNKKILPGLTDGLFRNDPLLAYLKQNSLEKFSGNAIQDNFIYGRLPGGFYSKGDAFDITQPQTENGLTWLPRFAYVDVSLFLEDVEVTNAGPEAVIKLADSRLQQAALNMSEILAIAQYRHGQNIAGDNRSTAIHGLSEGLNDGTNASWDGNTFPNYGTVARNSVNSVLNSPMTAPTSNVNGVISYDILERSYNGLVYGTEKPNLIVTTNLGMSYTKLKFQPAQRFESDAPNIGFTGLKFNGAMIMQSQYCPGTLGQSVSNGNFLASAGETMFFLNTKYLKFWVSTSAKFGFGFSGWKPAQDNNTIAGQYFYGGPGVTVTAGANRYHRQLFGITG